MNTDPLVLRITGTGGLGGSSVGEILARSAARSGFHIQCSRAFPAEIKGGTAWFQLRLSSRHIEWWGGEPHLEMNDVRGGDWVITCNGEGSDPQKADFSPLKIARESGNPRDANLVALGFLAGTLGLDEQITLDTAAQRYRRRGTELESLSSRVRDGFRAAESLDGWGRWTRGLGILPEVPSGLGILPKEPSNSGFQPDLGQDAQATRKLVMSANEAIALGALAAGVRFFCGYPITPASSILEFMLAELPGMGGTALQMEDEIAALAACLGASYAGKRAMCATSGPGFALMSELLNLAVVAELPVTIVDVQRSGPATGQPSRSEQADLMYAIHGSPGDSPRIVIAPTNVEECLYMTVRAVSLAERYQMPVIVLSDGALSNRIEAIPEPDWEALRVPERQRPLRTIDPEFERFIMTPTGVSPQPLPGVDDAPYIAGGMEHSAAGNPSATSEDHALMSAKRLRKLESAREEFLAEPGLDGLVPDARIGILGWGSTRGAIHEATQRLRAAGTPVSAAQVRFLNPLPEQHLTDWLVRFDRVIVAEENHSAQLRRLIEHLAPGRLISLLPDGQPGISPELIIEKVNEVNAGVNQSSSRRVPSEA